MKSEEVKIVLQKYFEAETTLAEEAMLREYFRQEELPDEMLPFSVWFKESDFRFPAEKNSSEENQTMEMFLQKERSRKRSIWWISVSGIAAALVIMLGSTLYFRSQPAYRDTFSDPVIASAYAVRTLQFVSGKYNEGIARLQPASKIREATRPVKKSLQIIEKSFDKADKIRLMNIVLK